VDLSVLEILICSSSSRDAFTKKMKKSGAEKQFHAKWFGYCLTSLQRDRNKPWFQTSAAMFMRSALFWGVTQRRVVILYLRFGATYRSHLQGSRSPMKQSCFTEPILCPETSVKDYHSTLRNTPEEYRSQKYHHSANRLVVHHCHILFVSSMLASPKNACCLSSFDICDARHIKPAAAMHMSSSSSFSF
jgi:hypothetical protein